MQYRRISATNGSISSAPLEARLAPLGEGRDALGRVPGGVQHGDGLDAVAGLAAVHAAVDHALADLDRERRPLGDLLAELQRGRDPLGRGQNTRALAEPVGPWGAYPLPGQDHELGRLPFDDVARPQDP